MSVGFYFLNVFLNNIVDTNNPVDSTKKTVLAGLVSVLNIALNLGLSLGYEYLVDIIVEKENHAYVILILNS